MQQRGAVALLGAYCGDTIERDENERYKMFMQQLRSHASYMSTSTAGPLDMVI